MIKAFLLFVFLTPHLVFSYQWETRVYLASYPCSGNHWVRYMIEEATGIATSSVYKDSKPPAHLAKVHPWGGYSTDHGYEGNARYPNVGEPVVVKTHFPVIKKRKFDGLPHKQVIRIIRHPIDSVYSYYVFGKKSSQHQFIPEIILDSLIGSWKKFQSYWDKQENVLTIYYEEICQDPITHLTRILEATGYSFTQEDVDRAVARYPPLFTPLKHLKHYTQKDLSLFRTKIGSLMQKHGYSIPRSL